MKMKLLLMYCTLGFLSSSVTCIYQEVVEPSRNLFKYLVLTSGVFHNEKQVLTNQLNGYDALHDNVSLIRKAVFIRALYDKITFIAQAKVNGKIFRNTVLVLTEDNGGVIHVQPLKVYSMGSHESCEGDDVDYSDIEFEPLTSEPVCESLYYSVEDDVYVGSIPICKNDTHEVFSTIDVTESCHSSTFKADTTKLPEKQAVLPYILFKQHSFRLLPNMINHKVVQKGETPCL